MYLKAKVTTVTLAFFLIRTASFIFNSKDDLFSTSTYFTKKSKTIKLILCLKQEVNMMTMKRIRYNNSDLACLCSN